jgi:metal-responsive CopG/Arc/MetJ family transcriptional regulator
MYDVAQLEKQQVALKLHKYLIDEIDEFTKEYVVNRADIITEAIKSYIHAQKEKNFYENFENSCNEVKMMIDGKMPETTLQEFINELDHSSNS